ncbi:hypothetical protein GCM10007424_01990 [Flavobacterium suaedae]|uniref:Uncharacterized protein n=2 Tax=Flavobacterium suaedae TaxID=1767027 RepID=A0ABQ1JGA4_9FLAO|nr:hypothetical protein GCM10007424_01990 [Flavobacterium suaedae]
MGCLLTLLNTYSNYAQLPVKETLKVLQKMDESLLNINTVVYKIDYKKKFLSSRDTVHTIAVCSLYIAPKDKMKAYNIVDLLVENSYGHRRYDGKRAFLKYHSVDSLTKDVEPQIYKRRRVRHAVVEGYKDLLLSEYLPREKSPHKYKLNDENEGRIENFTLTEDILNGTPVYLLTINFKDQDGIKDNVEKHYIRKSDYLPIAYYSYMWWETMVQYRYYEVDYLAINPDISLDEFKVDKNETINAEERYSTLMEKLKSEE